jgi:uncharacterized protein
MRFEWHTQKAESNLQKHGVTFEEARTVFDDPAQETLPDHLHSLGEARYLCVGTSAQGRVLAVIYTERADRIRIISAREATPREEYDYYEARGNLLN